MATIFLGEMISVNQNPWNIKNPADALFYEKKGALVVDDQGIILKVGSSELLCQEYKDAKIEKGEGCVILPGFVDSHIHFPQMDMIGTHSGELLEWLEKYTWPTEKSFADPEVVREAAEVFCQELFKNGTTFSSIFASNHEHCVDILFEAMYRHGARAIVGKPSMDQNCEPTLAISAEEDYEEQLRLIDKWHNKDGRLFYSVTPRFAPACSEKMLEMLGKLFRSRSDLFLQTHICENQSEVEWIKEIFPKEKDYFAVYERYGLSGERCVMAHAILCTEDERARMLKGGTSVAHCPTSNLFLGSGFFPFMKVAVSGMRVGLGTDIGAGTDFSLWQTMSEANKVAKILKKPVHPVHLLYAATEGGALCFGQHDLGRLEAGYKADFQVLKPGKNTLLARAWKKYKDPVEKLMALIHHADDRIVSKTFVNGREVYSV